jgi:hypothetical protein
MILSFAEMMGGLNKTLKSSDKAMLLSRFYPIGLPCNFLEAHYVS